MIRNLITISLMAWAVTAAGAQTFLDNLRAQEQGKGTVTVTEDVNIDKLVNGTTQPAPQEAPAVQPTAPADPSAAPAPAPAPKPATASSSADKPKTTVVYKPKPVVKTDDKKTQDGQQTIIVRKRIVKDTPETVDNHKKVMRNSYKTTGYRVQVFSGGNTREDRQKAETAGAVVKRSFPSEPIYVHFYSPSWKCRMGNYKEIGPARKALAKVKALGYPQACIVKGTISVQQ